MKKLIGGYQNTKDNEEDLALTPYLFLVHCDAKIIKVYGIGFCWFWCSVYIAIGFNLPKKYSGFKINKEK